MTSEVMVAGARGRYDWSMHPPRPGTRRLPPAGALLKEWRTARRLSQLALALEAGVSARHLSFVETGKARPSRDMVSRLAATLAMPLRERNAFFVAAGFAPEHPESALDAPTLARAGQAIELLLAHHEPYPAFVLDRRWNVRRATAGAARVAGFLAGSSRHANMVRQFCDPADLRRVTVNWEEVAADLLGHLREVIAANPADTEARSLLDEALAYPGVAEALRARGLAEAPSPLLTVHFRQGDQELRFFSTVTTFVTPRDVTLDEVRIECAYPADDATASFCRALAGG